VCSSVLYTVCSTSAVYTVLCAENNHCAVYSVLCALVNLLCALLSVVCGVWSRSTVQSKVIAVLTVGQSTYSGLLMVVL